MIQGGYVQEINHKGTSLFDTVILKLNFYADDIDEGWNSPTAN